MTLNYDIQNVFDLIGSKNTTTKAITPVTLKDYYDLDGTLTKKFETGGMSKLELIVEYTAGSGETSNSLQIVVWASDDGTNWRRLLNESVSDGTSTLTQREFTITQSTAEGTLAYDAQSANFTVGLKVTDVGGGSGYIEADTDSGTTGVLTLSNITAPFVNDQVITDSDSGSATVNGILTSITTLSLPLDISNKFHRISVKETGVASNAGTVYVGGVISGK